MGGAVSSEEGYLKAGSTVDHRLSAAEVSRLVDRLYSIATQEKGGRISLFKRLETRRQSRRASHKQLNEDTRSRSWFSRGPPSGGTGTRHDRGDRFLSMEDLLQGFPSVFHPFLEAIVSNVLRRMEGKKKMMKKSARGGSAQRGLSVSANRVPLDAVLLLGGISAYPQEKELEHLIIGSFYWKLVAVRENTEDGSESACNAFAGDSNQRRLGGALLYSVLVFGYLLHVYLQNSEANIFTEEEGNAAGAEAGQVFFASSGGAEGGLAQSSLQPIVTVATTQAEASRFLGGQKAAPPLEAEISGGANTPNALVGGGMSPYSAPSEFQEGSLQLSTPPILFPHIVAAFEEAWAAGTFKGATALKTGEGALVALMADWLASLLPFLSVTWRLGMKQLLFRSNGSQLQRESDADIALVRACSIAVLEKQTHSRGWQGHYLKHTSRMLSDALCFTLCQVTLQLDMFPWYRLYASWKQGRSLNRFAINVLHYSAPTILIMKTEKQGILGAFVNTEWKQSGGQFFGSSDTFLWKATPRFHIFKARGVGNNFVTLNVKSDYYPKGVGFGGKLGCCRLWMSDDFTTGYCCLSDTTYDPGFLYEEPTTSNENIPVKEEDAALFQVQFKIQDFEIWGCGGLDALKQQRLAQQAEEALLLERRKVDRGRFADNAFDREYLLGQQAAGDGRA